MKTNKNLIILVLVVAMVILAVFILSLKSNKTSITPPVLQSNTTVSSGEQTRIYKSKDLKFSVSIPSRFQVEEKFTTVFMKNVSGEILLSRVATNFENLNNYLDDLSKKNKILITDKKELTINQYDSIRGKIQYSSLENPTKTSYFIYVDNWVYSFSTSSPTLFDDLDQIAQSFRYTP